MAVAVTWATIRWIAAIRADVHLRGERLQVQLI